VGRKKNRNKELSIYICFKKGGRMMKTSIIRKEELLHLLNEMNHQLGRLEMSLLSCTLNQHEEWQKNQEMKMEKCGKQLDLIEMKVLSIEEHHKQYYKNRSLRLELTS
jgi:hypothetical protein